jgi:hypothetical protein
MRPVRYPDYLRRINDEVEISSQRTVSVGCHTAPAKSVSPSSMHAGAEAGVGPINPAGLRLVTERTETVVQQIIRETYQIRSLVSRGAVIDLIG